VEYGILGVAQTYAATGITFAKLQNAYAIWGNIEPQAGKYQWGPLDAVVLEYQQAGFTGLQMDLSTLSPWASSRQPTLGNPGDSFPKAEYLDDYVKYVTSVVERYDGDGVEDMPGLLTPIHDYGIEREFTGFWPGSAESYLRLLRLAYPAVKAADPKGNVLLVALLMTDIFDGYPTAEEINRRLAKTPTYMRKSVPEIQAILAACDSYDTVDFHALGNYTEIPLTAQWIRAQLLQNGCGEKPIWIGDAFPMSALIGYGGFVPPVPFAPATVETRDEVVTTLTSIADPASPDHTGAQAWLNGEMASGLVRKVAVSAAEGISGINLGNLEDWKTGIAGADKISVPALGASMFMGMTDTTVTTLKPGGDLPFNGQEWARARRAGSARPVYYALKLVNGKLGGFSSVSKLSSADLPGQVLDHDLWAYRFETQAGPVWVFWYDDGKLYLPGEKSPSVTIKLSFSAASARLTHTPTLANENEPRMEVLDASSGSLSFEVGATPIFIQAIP